MERGEEVSQVERVEYQVENELIDALTKHLSDNDARVGSAPLIALNDIWLERDAKKEHDKLKAEIHEVAMMSLIELLLPYSCSSLNSLQAE